LIEDIAKEKGVDVHLVRISDPEEIISYGIKSMPGVVLEGRVVHAGDIPDRQTVEAWM